MRNGKGKGRKLDGRSKDKGNNKGKGSEGYIDLECIMTVCVKFRRIQTVRAWPIDPLCLTGIQLEVSGSYTGIIGLWHLCVHSRLFLSLRLRSPKVSDCSPAKRERELRSDHQVRQVRHTESMVCGVVWCCVWRCGVLLCCCVAVVM